MELVRNCMEYLYGICVGICLELLFRGLENLLRVWIPVLTLVYVRDSSYVRLFSIWEPSMALLEP